MRKLCLLAVVILTGCHDESPVAPVDTWAPAVPRNVRSVTGDRSVFLSWIANTEPDVAGYRVYFSPCDDPNCLYEAIGTTPGTSFVVSPLQNGRTLFYAVTAFDAAGNESDLSYDTVFDTPRPEGSGLVLANVNVDSMRAGYDFSEYAVVPYNDPGVDVVYGTVGSQPLMVAPFVDTEIQDAGYASSLDAVDYAPPTGWSPTGTVELITGHCYVVLTLDEHYAKFRATSVTFNRVVLEWAYQVDAGNPELASRPEARPGPRIRRQIQGFSSLLGAGSP